MGTCTECTGSGILKEKVVGGGDSISYKYPKCWKCKGTGQFSGEQQCPNCDGRGVIYENDTSLLLAIGKTIASLGDYHSGHYTKEKKCRRCSGSGYV